MLFKNITIVDENFEIKDNCSVRINGDTIESIRGSEGDDLSQSGAAESDLKSEEVFDGSNYIMMPGFYNSHGHSAMSLMRGYGENLCLHDWLFTRIFPFEDNLTDEAVYYGTLLSMAESLRFGIVSTSDMYYHLDAECEAVGKSGAKANISRAVVNPMNDPFDDLISIKETKDAALRHQGEFSGRIIIESSLHAEYTSNEDTAIRLAELTKELGLRMHVHVAETKQEFDECKERHEGRTPTQYLADCGIFDVPTNAAHCVWLTDEDMDIIKSKGVYVSTNPVSNLKLASGICDVYGFLRRGVVVGLGTDSSASNNNLSMFEEMKTMSILAKTKHMNPTLISPAEALRIATRNGALLQGRDDAGLIKEGFKADLMLIKKDSPNMYPVHDLISNIVLSASDSDIYMTMVDGRILYRDGEFLTIDMDDTIRGANEAIKDILSRL